MEIFPASTARNRQANLHSCNYVRCLFALLKRLRGDCGSTGFPWKRFSHDNRRLKNNRFLKAVGTFHAFHNIGKMFCQRHFFYLLPPNPSWSCRRGWARIGRLPFRPCVGRCPVLAAPAANETFGDRKGDSQLGPCSSSSSAESSQTVPIGCRPDGQPQPCAEENWQ